MKHFCVGVSDVQTFAYNSRPSNTLNYGLRLIEMNMGCNHLFSKGLAKFNASHAVWGISYPLSDGYSCSHSIMAGNMLCNLSLKINNLSFVAR